MFSTLRDSSLLRVASTGVAAGLLCTVIVPYTGLTRSAAATTYAEWLSDALEIEADDAFLGAIEEALNARTLDAFIDAFFDAYEDSMEDEQSLDLLRLRATLLEWSQLSALDPPYVRVGEQADVKTQSRSIHDDFQVAAAILYTSRYLSNGVSALQPDVVTASRLIQILFSGQPLGP